MTARQKRPVENGQPYERPWWTARECWTHLGVSRQRWQRIVAEQKLEPQETDGVARFDPDVIEELGERLGLSNANDPSTVAITTLRETIESQSGYIVRIQDYNAVLIEKVTAENESLRKLRAEEQAAHLKSLEATQEALDHSAERAQMLQHAQGVELRQSLALEWLMTKIGPKILEQWKTSGHVKKIISLVQGLDDEQVEALKVLVNDEQREAIEALRKPEPAAEKREVKT